MPRATSAVCLGVFGAACATHAAAPPHPGALEAAGVPDTPPGSGALVGTVRDAAGRALAGVSVLVTPSAAPGSPPVRARGVATDSAGRFAWAALPAGRYALTVRRVGYVREERGARVRPGGTDSVAVVLRPDSLRLSEVCTAAYVPGLIVVVRGAPGGPGPDGATAVLRAGAWADTVREVGGHAADGAPLLQGAYERPGVYAVAVYATGYRPWRRAGVRVANQGCHVATVELEARLTRAVPSRRTGRRQRGAA